FALSAMVRLPHHLGRADYRGRGGGLSHQARAVRLERTVHLLATVRGGLRVAVPACVHGPARPEPAAGCRHCLSVGCLASPVSGYSCWGSCSSSASSS